MLESPNPRSVCKIRIKQNLKALVQDLGTVCVCVCVRVCVCVCVCEEREREIQQK